MEIFIIIALVLFNGIFAMSEMSLVSSRKFKLENFSKKGNQGAKMALKLSEHPTKFLSTVQIGITLIGILLGVYSGENITADAQILFSKIPLTREYASQLATATIVILITYLSIVLGELFPKRIAMAFPEKIIIVLARPMWILSVVTSPFVWLLTASNNIMLKILRVQNANEHILSKAEIRSLLKESTAVGEIQKTEQNIIERVFELGNRKVNSLYTHRRCIIHLKIDDSWAEVSQKIREEKHSAYPVSSTDSLDDLVGIVLIKDLFTHQPDQPFTLSQFMIDPVYIHENTFAFDALKTFKEKKLHYGIVFDEYGLVQGMITMDDVLDALVGDATEVYQKSLSIVQREDGSWLVDGQFKLVEFVKYFDLSPSEELISQSSTIAGLFISLSGEIPAIGDKQKIEGLELEIVDMDAGRVDKILVTKI